MQRSRTSGGYLIDSPPPTTTVCPSYKQTLSLTRDHWISIRRGAISCSGGTPCPFFWKPSGCVEGRACNFCLEPRHAMKTAPETRGWWVGWSEKKRCFFEQKPSPTEVVSIYGLDSFRSWICCGCVRRMKNIQIHETKAQANEQHSTLIYCSCFLFRQKVDS